MEHNQKKYIHNMRNTEEEGKEKGKKEYLKQ